MLYEYRVYHALPGKLPQLNERFAKITLSFFEKHGIKVIGFWTPLIGGASNQLIYLLAYESLAQREEAWSAFQSDPAWLQARAATEKEGQVVSHIENMILKPTDYSPLK